MKHIRLEIKGVRTVILDWDKISDVHKQALEAENLWQSVDDMAVVEPFLKDGIMWTGRIWAVCDQLEDLGYSVEVITHDFQGTKYDWEFNMDYRPYQEEFVNSVLEFQYGVFQAPPGFGKTICSAAIIAACGRKTAFITQAEEPLKQAAKKIGKALGGIEVGIVGDSIRNLQPITVFTIQTISKYLARDENGFITSRWDRDVDPEIRQWFADCEVVIIDEAHHAQASSYTHFLGTLHHAKIIAGVTATPEVGGDRQDFLEAYLGPVHFRLEYDQCIDAGILVPLKFYTTKVAPKDYGYIDPDTKRPKVKSKHAVGKQYQKVEKDYIVKNRARNQLAVDFARNLNEQNMSCAIIVSKVEHAEEIAKLMPEAVVITGKTNSKYRKEVLDSEEGLLMTKKIMTIISTVLDEAVDIASLNGVALMAGGKSMIKFYQRLRNSRSFAGYTSLGWEKKECGHVFYPIDQCDFLKSHSQTVLAAIKKLVKQHPKNTLEEI